MDTEELQPSGSNKKKVYIALGAILLLLLVAGCFYLFPFGFAGQPVLQASKRQPSVVSSKTYVNMGDVLALSGDTTGFWRIGSKDSAVTVNRFGLAGSTEWVGDYSMGEPIWDTNGRELVLADRQGGQAHLLTETGLKRTVTLAGKPQVVAVAESGHFLASTIPTDAKASTMQPKLSYYSPGGELLFATNLENAAPLLIRLNQNGTQIFMVVSKLSASGVSHQLISYSDSGQPLWSTELVGSAISGMIVKPYGDRVAVAVDKLIYLYSGAGQLLWQSTAQGTIYDLAFVGQGDQLVYSGEKVSALSFQKQSMLTSLGADGTVLWQRQIKGSVPLLASGTNALTVFLANDRGVHDLGTDGKVRWTYPVSADSKSKELLTVRLAANASGSAVLVQLSDGRMFVLRGE